MYSDGKWNNHTRMEQNADVKFIVTQLHSFIQSQNHNSNELMCQCLLLLLLGFLVILCPLSFFPVSRQITLSNNNNSIKWSRWTKSNTFLINRLSASSIFFIVLIWDFLSLSLSLVRNSFIKKCAFQIMCANVK